MEESRRQNSFIEKQLRDGPFTVTCSLSLQVEESRWQNSVIEKQLRDGPFNLFLSLKVEESRRQNSVIEKQLRDEKKRMKNRVKILLLGCGEAGKVSNAYSLIVK